MSKVAEKMDEVDDLLSEFDEGEMCVEHVLERLVAMFPEKREEFEFIDMMFHENLQMVFENFMSRVQDVVHDDYEDAKPKANA